MNTDQDALRRVMTHQAAWAKDRGLRVDANGYLESVEANLFQPLSAASLTDFEHGSGNELGGSDRRPGEIAKMRALHSSSALVCNVFDYWRERDLGAIGRALEVPFGLETVRMEAQFRTGLRGTPPTLDLLLQSALGDICAVESKFTEPYQAVRARDAAPFAESYFPEGPGLWEQHGLPRCQRLAEALRGREAAFQFLDVAQLLKHALGLGRRTEPVSLIFLWFAVDGPQSCQLAGEVESFAAEVDDLLNFRPLQYRQVLESLLAEQSASAAYTSYIRERYLAVHAH